MEQEVFTLWIDHGVRPQGRRGGLNHRPVSPEDVTYQYVVTPGSGPVPRKLPNELQILANNRHLQGVSHSGLGICQAVFYRGGSLKISDNLTLTIDSPGAVMLKLDGDRVQEITVADPTRNLDRIHLEISGILRFPVINDIRVDYDENRQSTHVAISLPKGDYAGKSISAKTL